MGRNFIQSLQAAAPPFFPCCPLSLTKDCWAPGTGKTKCPHLTLTVYTETFVTNSLWIPAGFIVLPSSLLVFEALLQESGLKCLLHQNHSEPSHLSNIHVQQIPQPSGLIMSATPKKTWPHWVHLSSLSGAQDGFLGGGGVKKQHSLGATILGFLPNWGSSPAEISSQLATIHSGKGTLHSLLTRVLHHPSHCCHHFLLPFFLSLYLTMWPLYSPCWPITHSRDYIDLQIIEIQLSQPPFTGMKGVHHI